MGEAASIHPNKHHIQSILRLNFTDFFYFFSSRRKNRGKKESRVVKAKIKDDKSNFNKLLPVTKRGHKLAMPQGTSPLIGFVTFLQVFVYVNACTCIRKCTRPCIWVRARSGVTFFIASLVSMV